VAEVRDAELMRLLEEASKRTGRLDQLDWNDLMYEPQREFIEDKSRLKVACCSRRAGKSHGIALALLKAGFKHPHSYPVYVNMNRASAKVIIWPALQTINNELNLGLTFNQATSDVKLPNGSEIKVYGAGTRREMDKIRGGKPPIACLDEAQNMGSDMEYLISQILLPATADYKAPILVTGTPSAAFDTPFYNIIHGKGMTEKSKDLAWSVHHWTMMDNPYIKDVEEEYDLACAANGWTRQSPGFRREYLGEWIRDDIGMCFELKSSFIVDRWPRKRADDWRFILGIDLGTVDPCAFTVLAYSRSLAQTYVLASYKNQFTTLQAGTEIERLMEEFAFDNIVVDSGGQGAAFVKQWKETHPTIPAMPVKKGYNSVDMSINIINADARAGKIFIVKSGCQQLIDEMQILIWDPKKSVSGARKVKGGDNYPDHCADSYRYAYQKVRTHSTKGMLWDDGVEPGSRIWIERKLAARKLEELSGDVGEAPEPYWRKLVARPNLTS
jgi:hypothetical protein